jgi:hypothetical protein
MANLKFTLKRNTNGTNYDELYPKTVADQVGGLSTLLDAKINTTAIGANGGVASLDSAGKIPVAQLPDSVFDSLFFYSTVSGTDTLKGMFNNARFNAATLKRGVLGYYWVAIASTVLTASSTPEQITTGVWASASFGPGEEGTSLASDTTQTIEAGDWIIITGIENEGTELSPYVVTFAIVNNTYELASDTVDGIVRLSDGNGGIITELSGTSVITEGNLAGLLLSGDQNNAATNKIAVSGHTHSQYQPVDADLTAIAGLTPTDNNFIVGNGTSWTAESGNTVRTSLGLTIGSDVQAYDAGLASIAGLTTQADRMIYTTAADTYAVTTLTTFGRSILDDADAAAVRSTIGAQIAGSYQTTLTAAEASAIAAGAANEDSKFWNSTSSLWENKTPAQALTILGAQASNARLADIVGLAVTDGNFIVGNGTNWVAESGDTVRTSLGVYSTTQVDAFFTNRPTIFYNTVEGAVAGSLILADVTAI